VTVTPSSHETSARSDATIGSPPFQIRVIVAEEDSLRLVSVSDQDILTGSGVRIKDLISLVLLVPARESWIHEVRRKSSVTSCGNCIAVRARLSASDRPDELRRKLQSPTSRRSGQSLTDPVNSFLFSRQRSAAIPPDLKDRSETVRARPVSLVVAVAVASPSQGYRGSVSSDEGDAEASSSLASGSRQRI